MIRTTHHPLAGCALALCLTACSSAGTTAAAAKHYDASTAATGLAATGAAADVVTTTASNDPNKLLDRPGQYLTRATFTIPGVTGTDTGGQECSRGGCVEQWPDQAAAQQRADYIGQIAKKLPFAVEYDYVRADGLLLRVTRAATPD